MGQGRSYRGDNGSLHSANLATAARGIRAAISNSGGIPRIHSCCARLRASRRPPLAAILRGTSDAPRKLLPRDVCGPGAVARQGAHISAAGLRPSRRASSCGILRRRARGRPGASTRGRSPTARPTPAWKPSRSPDPPRPTTCTPAGTRGRGDAGAPRPRSPSHARRAVRSCLTPPRPRPHRGSRRWPARIRVSRDR
jgi:hypothetical protein